MKTLFILSASPCRKQISCIFTFLLGLILFINLTACSEQNDDFSCPEAMDDATLLASQLKLLKTRANNATNTILVTTSTAVSFTVEKSSQIVIDWGDGNSDIDVFSHTYTDNLPVHTITFNGTQNAIQKLDCHQQEIIFLDVTKDTLLTELICRNNRISQLNLSDNIKKLNCSYNNLKTLDISSSKSLLELQCNSNNLSQLDASHNKYLNILTCSDNQLESLDVSLNLDLVYLSCSNCRLSKLDIRNNLHLERLECASNQLTGTLDITSLKELKYFMCMYNRLDSINISSDNKNLIEIWCYNNQLSSLTIPDQSSIQTIYCHNNRLKKLALPNCPELTFIYCHNNDFEQELTQLLIFISSLPYKNPATFSIVSLSPDYPYLSTIRPIAESKNWLLTFVDMK